MPLPNSPLFHQGLKMMGKCPVCQYRLNPLEIRVLEEGEDVYLIYLRCQHCQSSIVALVMAGIFGVTSIGLITDLSAEEVIKFKNSRPLKSDDVIEIHQLLKQKQTIKEWLK